MALLILTPFVRSVSPGYTPLITRFYYLAEGANAHRDRQRIQYTDALTWIWIALICMILLETVLLSLFASLDIWSLFTNFINYLILVSFMVVEWLFRNYYFRQWVSPFVFIKQLALVNQHELLRKE